MCELFGMSLNLPDRPTHAFFEELVEHRGNEDGWGLAWYRDDSVQVIKEPNDITTSQLTRLLSDYSEIRSDLFVGHLRQATDGNPKYCNTHPFCRELYGRDYTFAHNGKLDRDPQNRFFRKHLNLGIFQPVGETDSEHAFCFILKRIQERNVSVWDGREFEWLLGVLEEINQYGHLNCIFSDGEHLFCYYGRSAHKKLYHNYRQHPFLSGITSKTRGLKLHLDVEKSADQSGHIVATEELTVGEKWEELRPGELVVFTRGQMLYSNKRTLPESAHSQELRHINEAVLSAIRESKGAISMRSISEMTALTKNQVRCAILSLKNSGLIKADGRCAGLRIDNNNTTYHT